ncbi:MAG: TIGR03905 family TSCPD domain-containing protein [Clostridium sp.]
MYTYKPSGVCSKEISFDVKDNKIKDVSFIGGCSGNLQGVSRLLSGLTVTEAIDKLEGITCGSKNTSCPDQFVQALKTLILNK